MKKNNQDLAKANQQPVPANQHEIGEGESGVKQAVMEMFKDLVKLPPKELEAKINYLREWVSVQEQKRKQRRLIFGEPELTPEQQELSDHLMMLDEEYDRVTNGQTRDC